MKNSVLVRSLLVMTIATFIGLPCIPSAQAEPLTSNEQRFLTKMLRGNAEFGAAPLVVEPGYSPNGIVALGHYVVDTVRKGVNPFDTQTLIMRSYPSFSEKQGARLVVQALWDLDPGVAQFYYTDASPLPPGCWVIRQIDLKCE